MNTRYPVAAISCSTLEREKRSKDLEQGFKSMMQQCQKGRHDSVISNPTSSTESGHRENIFYS